MCVFYNIVLCWHSLKSRLCTAMVRFNGFKSHCYSRPVVVYCFNLLHLFLLVNLCACMSVYVCVYMCIVYLN